MSKIPSFVFLLLSLAAGIAVPVTSYAQEVPDEVVPPSESDDGTGAALDQIDAHLRAAAAEVDAPEIASRIDAIPTDSTVDAEEFRALLQEFTARALLASTSAATVDAEHLPRVRQILRRGAAGSGQRLEAALTELEEEFGDPCYTQALALVQDAADPEVDVASLGQQVIGLIESLRSDDDAGTTLRVLSEGVRLLRRSSGR